MADDDPRGPRDDLELYRHELDRLRQAALELRRAYHEQERELESLRREAAEVEERYERLRSHRAVRALVRGARVVRSPAASAAGDHERAEVGAARVHAGDGPQRFRERLESRLHARVGTALAVDVVGAAPGAGALAEALAAFGWEVRRLERPEPGGRADAVVLCEPAAGGRAVPRHAVVAGLALDRLGEWTASAWFDDLDVAVVGDERAAATVAERTASVAHPLEGGDAGGALRAALLGWCAATRVSLTVATPTWDVAEWWGDTHYGRALQRQLERRGHPTRLYLREEFTAPHVARADVALHLFGLAAPRPHPEQVSVLWVISHPELVDGRRCSGYNLVLVASERFAARLTPLVDAPVLPLPQATDAERFRPEATGPAHDLLFVGNSRRTRRTIIDDVTPTRHDLAVYGGDWTPDLLDPRHLRGEVVPNTELHRYYASARIVLNDHWPEMAALGFVSNRIYDALAAGALVITDPVEGLDRQFDGAVVTYRDRDDLRRLVERYLADEPARRERAAAGRRAVLERHTFAHRTDRLLELLAPYLAARP